MKLIVAISQPYLICTCMKNDEFSINTLNKNNLTIKIQIEHEKPNEPLLSCEILKMLMKNSVLFGRTQSFTQVT